MNSNEAISRLSVLFPSKTENYLRRQYRKCNYDLPETIQAINNDISSETNSLSRFFGSVIRGFQNLCLCSSSPEDDGFDNFTTRSSNSLIAPRRSPPVVQVPVAVVDRPHSVFVIGQQENQNQIERNRQQQIQNQIARNRVKQAEIFARRLQEEERRASAVVKPTEFTREGNFKGPAERPKVHRQESFVPQRIKIVYVDEDEDDEVDENDLAFIPSESSGTHHREQAQQHLKINKQFKKQAQQCLRANDRQRAAYYFKQAEKQRVLFEEANNKAAAAFLAENVGNKKNTIDFHHLFVKEAIQALDDFLDKEIINLEDNDIHSKALNVITGRGKHNPDGIPKIKPAVMKRLRARSLKFSELNPGCLRVHIFQDSVLTNELMD